MWPEWFILRGFGGTLMVLMAQKIVMQNIRHSQEFIHVVLFVTETENTK